MHKEIILRWAMQAGCTANEANAWITTLERFATIVADATIKASQDYKLGYADGAFAEREALAAEAEKNGNIILAMQIRARENT